MKIYLSIVTAFLLLHACSIPNKKSKNTIEWSSMIDADFLFHKEWSYPEGVYINMHNQVSCDGYCPPEVDKMKDEQGKLLSDSLTSFYKLVDTSHLSHSLNSKTNIVEWSGANFIDFSYDSLGGIVGSSSTNASTHAWLTIALTNDTFNAFAELNSIRMINQKKYEMESGKLTVDSAFFSKGIVKAIFNFQFTDSIYWSGTIYSKIKPYETN